MLSVDTMEALTNALHTGERVKISCKIDTVGLGDAIGVELVSYHDHDGQSEFDGTRELHVVNREGNVYTYELDFVVKDAGVFRSALRTYPKNGELAHRQDFAYERWFLSGHSGVGHAR